MQSELPARTRVKICGLTRVQDVEAAVRAGADAVGLVFYPGSSRAVSLAQARALRQAVPAFVSVVALFVNPASRDVEAVLEHVAPDILQFHGDETPGFCAGFGHRYMRAFRIGAPGLATADDVLATCRRYDSACAWLFDSFSEGYGGSGQALDINLLEQVRNAQDTRALVLAGGLRAETVSSSIARVRPYAVDVSTGVEVEPGIKSAEKIAAFMRAVNGESPAP